MTAVAAATDQAALPQPSAVLLGDILAAYGEEHGTTVKDPVRLGVAINRLSGYWGGRTAAEISKTSIEAYAKARRAEFAKTERERVKQAIVAGQTPAPARTLSDATIRRELVNLRAALRYAHATRRLSEVPTMVLPKGGESRVDYLTRDEVARLVRAARNLPRATYLPLFILIAFYTGARMRAILRLRWQQHTDGGGWVDLKRGEIDFLGHDTQTKKQRARIPIPDRLLALLRLARTRTFQHVIEFEGRPIDDVKVAMRSAAKAAGLDDFHTHMLKHSAISHLLQQGVSIWAVSRWTATSVRTIEKVYAHVSKDMTGEVQDALRRPGTRRR
jgi:integrase